MNHNAAPVNPLDQMPTGQTSARVDEILGGSLSADAKSTLAVDTLVGAGFRLMGPDYAMGGLLNVPPSPNNPRVDPTGLSRQDGLRKSVMLVTSNDEIRENVLRDLSSGSFVREVDGHPAFRSLDQVAAYLAAETDQERMAITGVDKATPWKDTLVTEIEAYAKTPGRLSVLGGEQGVGNADEVLKAKQLAVKAGVDISLLARTAEALRTAQEKMGGVGTVALMGVQQVPNYDAMFQ